MIEKFSINEELIQMYVLMDKRENIPEKRDNYRNIYEFTITFNRSYWSLDYALNQGIKQAIADIIKPISRQFNTLMKDAYVIYYVEYVVEYHEDGFPHIHGRVVMDGIDNYRTIIEPSTQQSIHMRLIRRYGRSQWYYTQGEDKVHINDNYKNGIKWSDYIKKDVMKNESRGLRHRYIYEITINKKRNL